jgi:hypothetical protein
MAVQELHHLLQVHQLHTLAVAVAVFMLQQDKPQALEAQVAVAQAVELQAQLLELMELQTREVVVAVVLVVEVLEATEALAL